MSNQEGKELRWFFDVIRRWWWLITLFVLLPTVIVFMVFSNIRPVYQAMVTVMVKPASNGITNDYSVLIAGERMAITYSQIIKTQVVLQKVIDELKLDTNPNELSKRMEAIPISNTELIQLTVSDSDPRQAALIANTTARVLTEHIQSLNIERQSKTLSDIQDKINTVSAQITELRSKRDALNEKIIGQTTEITRLNSSLEQDKLNLINLQQNYHTLQINVTQITDKIHIVEPAKIQTIYGLIMPQAVVTLLIDQDMVSGGNMYAREPNSLQLAQIYGRMMTNPSVLQEAISQLNYKISPTDLVGKVVIEPIEGTQLIRLKVYDAVPTRAIQLANTIANVFVAQVQAQLASPYSGRLTVIQSQMDDLSKQIDQTQADLQTPTTQQGKMQADLSNMEQTLSQYRSDLGMYQQEYDNLLSVTTSAASDVVISEMANVPTAPLDNRSLYTSIVAALGLLLGVGTAFVLESLWDRIRTPQDVVNTLGVNILSSIGSLEKGKKEFVMSLPGGNPIQEDFHLLSTKIRSLSKNQPIHSMLITSPSAFDGKSFVVANLAAAMAKTGMKVVAVDADLHFPRLHKILGVKLEDGLADTLTQQDFGVHLQQTLIMGLKVLSGGASPANPIEVLHSPRLGKIINDLQQDCDLVLIDCPPLLSTADTSILSSMVDGVLLVLRADHSSSATARDAFKNLDQCSACFKAVVLNDIKESRDGYYRYEGRLTKGNSLLLAWNQSVSSVISFFKKM
jgi:polysaccharide biosynthesis transport protein